MAGLEIGKPSGPGQVDLQSTNLRLALEGDRQAFSALVEPYRRELLTHCYRMLGSLEDAEDQVQETFLKAWKRLETYAGRASLRAWLYKIATNSCLDVLEKRPRRSLPLEGELSAGPALPPPAPVLEPVWLEPFPDDWLAPSSAEPEARFDAYESICLAFLVALQALPPRQRSVLIFKDVLDWSMAEIAEILGVTSASATSLVYRARTAMKHHQISRPRDSLNIRWENEQTRELLERYMRAWEAADIEGIVSLLAEDVAFPMPPYPLRILGKSAVREFIRAAMFADGMADQWKLLPIRANGLPGFAFYRGGEGNARYQPFALQVTQFEKGMITEAITFGFPTLFRFFGLPASL